MWTFKYTGTLTDTSGMYIVLQPIRHYEIKLKHKNVILAGLNWFFHSQYFVIK